MEGHMKKIKHNVLPSEAFNDVESMKYWIEQCFGIRPEDWMAKLVDRQDRIWI